VLSPLRALRKGGGDWDRFARRAKVLLDQSRDAGVEGEVVREAVALVLAEVAETRPELQLPP